MWGRKATPDQDLSWKCVTTHYYWSIPFSNENSIFFCFVTCMPYIYTWGTNYTFLQLLQSKVFINISVPKWDNFWGVNSGSGASSRSIFGLQCFDLNLGPTLVPALFTSMSHLSSLGKVNSASSSSFGLLLFDLQLGSTLSLTLVPSMSHLS